MKYQTFQNTNKQRYPDQLYRLGMFMFWQIAVARPLSRASLTYPVCNYFSGQKNKFVRSFFGRSFGLTIFFRDLLTFRKIHNLLNRPINKYISGRHTSHYNRQQKKVSLLVCFQHCKVKLNLSWHSCGSKLCHKVRVTRKVLKESVLKGCFFERLLCVVSKYF